MLRSIFFNPAKSAPTSTVAVKSAALRFCSSSSSSSTNSAPSFDGAASAPTPHFVRVTGTNTHLPVRPISVSRTTFSDIVGEHTSSSAALARPERISAGDLLGLTDACAAQAAARHVFGRSASRVPTPNREDTPNSAIHLGAYSVTTVAFQEISLKTPVMSGDFLNLTGEVVNVGGSSLDVHVRVDKMQFPTVPGERRQVHVADAYASFVAIGKDLRPVKAVPPLGHEDASSVATSERAKYLKQLNQLRTGEEADIDKMTLLECRDATEAMQSQIKELFEGTAHETEHERSASATATAAGGSNSPPPLVTMRAATLEAHRFFLQGFQNMHSTIFGGEILRWMEKHAVYCGRRFACNFEVHTLAMHSVQFHQPIFYTDAVSLRARVVNVRNSTMEVDVEVFVDRADGRHLTSNCASFVLVSLSNFGKPRPIGIKLDMKDASLEESIAHVKAMKRYLRLAACKVASEVDGFRLKKK